MRPSRPLNGQRRKKNALAQADGNDADDWRTAFRAAGGVLSDELKQRHIERVARRELVQEYDNLAVVLNFERERLKGACDSTATAYRKAHHHLLSLYAEHELEHALNETCEALVRAMHLSIGTGKSARQHHRPSGLRRAGKGCHAAGEIIAGTEN